MTRANDVKLMEFVHGPLNDCIKAAVHGVERLRYVEDATDNSNPLDPVHYEQAVIIAYKNGYRKVVNVHMDSPLGAIHDVLRAIER